jgi:3-methyladenine DNA glycosylase AlkD
VAIKVTESVDLYVQKLVHIYSENTDEGFANWSKNYLRNQFEFLGIRTPLRRKLTKEFMKDHGLPKKEQLKDVVLMLWELPEREYQKAALDILEKAKRELTVDDMPWLTSLIMKKSWWDTVDVLSPHIMGYLFLKNSELISTYSDLWIEDDHIWLQRTAILYQLYYKEKTNEERLFHYILRRADSEEFFIQKAIGWALRQYAKTNPDTVKNFVANHSLQPLSKREALKHF